MEFWSPPPSERHCRLPSVSRSMQYHTVSVARDSPVVCHENSCDQFTGTSWEPLQSTLHCRTDHSAAVLGDLLLLLGGVYSPHTTELVPLYGGVSQPGFPLETARYGHCSIQVSQTVIVLTGGAAMDSLVTEYSDIQLGQEVTIRELPTLNFGRSHHACGLYETEGSQVLSELCLETVMNE